MKKTYSIVFLLVATELIGFGLIIPVLPQISNNYTTSGVLIGILLASYSIAQFIAAPILGQLSDRVGRKPILIFSKIGTILSYILLAFSQSYHLLLISRLLDGFTGGNIAVARAYLTDITAEENRSKAMAIIGMGFAIGFIIGPAIGGICYQYTNDFSIAGLVGASLSGISLLITILGIKETKLKKTQKEKPKLFSTIRQLSKQTIIILLTYGFVMVVFSGFETSFSLYTNLRFNFSESKNSLLFFIIGIISFLIQGSLMKITVKPFKKAIYIALSLISTSMILTNIIPGTWSSLSVLGLLLIGFGIINTHIPAELSKKNNSQKGLILGVYEGIGSIARILGPLIVYFTLYKQIQYLYLILGLILFMWIIIFGILTKKFQY